MSKLTLSEIKEMASLFAASRMFKGVESLAQAFVKIQAGQEFGFGPFVAMQSFSIIQGKVELNADAQARLVKQSGRYDYRVVEHTEQVCEIMFYEVEPENMRPAKAIAQGGAPRYELGTSRFTIEDAKRANLLNSDTWKKYSRNMLFARALTNGVAWHCPDVVACRVYSEGEIENETGSGTLAPADTTGAPSPSSGPIRSLSPPQKDTSLTLKDMARQRAKELVESKVGQQTEQLAADLKMTHDEQARTLAMLHDAGLVDSVTHDEDGQPVHPLDDPIPVEEGRAISQAELRSLVADVVMEVLRLVKSRPDPERLPAMRALMKEVLGVEVEAKTTKSLREELLAKNLPPNQLRDAWIVLADRGRES